LVERVRRLKVGHPLDDATEVGPLIDPGHFAKVSGYVETGLKDGATLAAGGKRIGTEGSFIEADPVHECPFRYADRSGRGVRPVPDSDPLPSMRPRR
jgi:hypothetical protein